MIDDSARQSDRVRARARTERAKKDVLDFGQGVLSLARENARLLAALLAALVFVALLEDVAEGQILQLDALAYSFFVEGLRSDWLTPVMEGLTGLAAVPVVAAATLVIAALVPGRRPGVCVGLNLVCVVALNALLKALIQRPRPEGFRLIDETGYSFPSGHSMVSMAFYGLIIWMVWRSHRRGPVRALWCAVFGLMIVMVGISRIYLGVHYASDVVAGFCVSMIWLAFYTHTAAPVLMGHTEGEGHGV